MGQQQSKDELLYQQVNYGNIEGIKALCREGAQLEWIDKQGKTPLIEACMNAELFNVAKTLIELGANVNAYRPGSHAGTPLHHAAKRGLEQTVKLLLSHGAKALVMNDDCQTPLDVARAKGYSNVVHTIERHICLFSGWLRVLYGPGFLEALAPQWLSKKMWGLSWVAVIPSGSRHPAKPLKLELAIYSSSQEAQPRTVIALWKVKIEEPKFHHPDPTLIIFDDHSKTQYKFASANEGDKQQLHWFYNACIGISQSTFQVMHNAPFSAATAPPTTAEDVDLAMAINASIHSSMEERPPLPNTDLSSGVSNTVGWENSAANPRNNIWAPSGGPAPPSKGSTSEWSDRPAKDAYNGWDGSKAGPSSSATLQSLPAGTASIPSAPPIPVGGDNGAVQYPIIDSRPVDLPMPSMDDMSGRASELKEDGGASSSCVICLDAPIEGACIPCGHMAGCMSCLNEIKAKKWGCPVCRAKIQQVVRLYAV